MSRLVKLKIAFGATSIVILHSMLIKNTRKPKTSNFYLGSADDLITNALQTGDLVLFSRTWYKYYLPVGLMIQLYKTIYQCDYDHCGIIIINNKGIPYVLENTPFLGYQYRSFEERIRHSQSTHITVIPIKPNLILTNIQQQQLNEYLNNKLLIKAWKSNEIIDNIKGFYNYLINYKLFHSNNHQNIHYCSNLKLISNTFQSILINIVNNSNNININTLQLIENRNIQLIYTEDPKIIYDLHETNIMIRSS